MKELLCMIKSLFFHVQVFPDLFGKMKRIKSSHVSAPTAVYQWPDRQGSPTQYD